MTALSFLPSNALVAAFPAYHPSQPSIRAQEGRERWAARKAEIEASHPVGFQPRISVVYPCRADEILGAKPVPYFVGRSGERHAFVRVTGANRDALAASPVVLLASRSVPGRRDTLGVEVFEAEGAARLAAWLDRADIAKGVELFACYAAGSRIERAAIVVSLSDKPARTSAFVIDGQYDRRAIMVAAVAQAKALRIATGSAWGVCLSAALRDVWQAAKAARLAAAH